MSVRYRQGGRESGVVVKRGSTVHIRTCIMKRSFISVKKLASTVVSYVAYRWLCTMLRSSPSYTESLNPI